MKSLLIEISDLPHPLIGSLGQFGMILPVPGSFGSAQGETLPMQLDLAPSQINQECGAAACARDLVHCCDYIPVGIALILECAP